MSSEKEIFFAPIKERYRLNHPSSQKKTYHIVLDISHLDITYCVGDCVAVYPRNPSDKVANLIKITNGNEKDFALLSQKYNIARVNRSLLQKVGIENWSDDVETFLEKTETQITASELLTYLSPLLPRFYSIASSMKHVGKEAHLTVVLTEYESQEKKIIGTCSEFLTQTASLNEQIPLYFLKDREFTLSNAMQNKPIIMIGPGTGIAPFLGFMQERIAANHTGKNWLFFGERNRHSDFYYETYWQQLVSQKALKLDLAFSRDQNEKVYVQHKMLANGKEFFSWLEEGAYLFVSGDAKNMAKDVDKTLHQIVKEHGCLSEESTKEYIKNLKRQKRYLKDVY